MHGGVPHNVRNKCAADYGFGIAWYQRWYWSLLTGQLGYMAVPVANYLPNYLFAGLRYFPTCGVVPISLAKSSWESVAVLKKQCVFSSVLSPNQPCHRPIAIRLKSPKLALKSARGYVPRNKNSCDEPFMFRNNHLSGSASGPRFDSFQASSSAMP